MGGIAINAQFHSTVSPLFSSRSNPNYLPQLLLRRENNHHPSPGARPRKGSQLLLPHIRLDDPYSPLSLTLHLSLSSSPFAFAFSGRSCSHFYSCTSANTKSLPPPANILYPRSPLHRPPLPLGLAPLHVRIRSHNFCHRLDQDQKRRIHFGRHSFRAPITWRIQGISGITGEVLYGAFDWLCIQLNAREPFISHGHRNATEDFQRRCYCMRE